MSDIELWSELASGNGSNSPDGFPEGMAPGGVNNSAREVMAATKRWYDRRSPVVSTTGATDGNGRAPAYALTYSQAPTNYIQGQVYSFKAHARNTAGATLNINGLGAKQIYMRRNMGYVAVAQDWLFQAVYYNVVYDTTLGAFVVMDSAAPEAPYSILRSASTVVIPDSTPVTVTWNVNGGNTLGGIDEAQSVWSAIVLGTGGLYSIRASMNFNEAAAGAREIRILINGAIYALDRRVALPSGDTTLSCGVDLAVGANSLAAVQVFQNSGAALGVGSVGWAHFSVVRL